MDIENLTEVYIIAYEKALEMTGNPETATLTAYAISKIVLDSAVATNNKSSQSVATLIANVLAINKRDNKHSKQVGESK